MTDSYLVRCKEAPGRAMAGIYAAKLTTTGMVATWKPERAALYDTQDSAAAVATRLTHKFSGTTWEAVHV